VSSDIKVILGLPIETAEGGFKFASLGELGLPLAVTPGLPMAAKNQKM
jgi:hypothetical protein